MSDKKEQEPALADVSNEPRKQKKGSSKAKGLRDTSIGVATVAAATAIPTVASFPLAAGVFGFLAAKYLALPINKNLEPVNVVSETWKDRPKANMVKWMMQRSGMTPKALAKYFGYSENYFNNKLTRDSFSFDDLVIIAYACGYSFVLAENNGEATSENSFRVDLLNYFNNKEGINTLERISGIEEEKQKIKREEYEKKKAELERMKAEYGFED